MCYCPTPTLHLNLALTGDGAFVFSLKKNYIFPHSVWFISVLNYGDTENVLINHLLLVIPMSYPCHYTNLCPHKPHKHAHTHTHTLSHTLSCSHTHTHTYIHSHTHTHTHTHSLSLSHTLSHTHTLSLTHTFSLTHSLSLTLSLSLSLTHTHSLSHTHTHTHTHTQSLTHTHTERKKDRQTHTHTHTWCLTNHLSWYCQEKRRCFKHAFRVGCSKWTYMDSSPSQTVHHV